MKKKSKVFVCFDQDVLLDFRKILFEQGITVETFFAHLIKKTTLRDKVVLELIKESAVERKDALKKGNGNRKDSFDANALYALIRQELSNEKQSDGE